MITGVLFGTVLVSPAITLLQAMITSRTIDYIEKELVLRHDEFIDFYKGMV
jgi:hypothetical protein